MGDDAAENITKRKVRVRVKLLRFFPKYVAITAGSVRC
jgi:hypothetical protein